MNYPATTAVITLSRPFNLNGKEIIELTMREPRVIDKIQFEKSSGVFLEREGTMLAGLCGLNSSDIHNLPAYDYDQLVKAFNRFLLPPAEREGKPEESTASQSSEDSSLTSQE